MMSTAYRGPTPCRLAVEIASAVAAVVVCGGCAPQDTRSAAAHEFVIQTPSGGDCALLLQGSWKDRTCTVDYLTIQEDETLTVRRDAILVVRAQMVNFGVVHLRAGDPTGSAELRLGEGKSAGAFVNGGYLYISPKEGIASPGLSNRFNMVNTGLIANFTIGTGGIFNNFATIINRGQIVNTGFLHNSGPPVSETQARISSVEEGVLFNLNGTIENFGVIEGPVVGDCPGTCQ